MENGDKKILAEITVVIVNYNGIRYIEDCLHSLFSQRADTPPFEVVVVDNASADGSAQVIAEQFPQIKLIKLEENTGFCKGSNTGILASDSPYVILLNNDTKVEAGFVKALYDAMKKQEKDSKCFSVSAKMLMWDRPELLDDAGDRYCALGWAYARGKGKPEAEFDRPAEIFASCGGAAIYRRAVLEEIGLLDENHFAYLEDTDIGYRARIYGYKSYFEPSARVLHFGSASTGSRYNAWKTERAAANSVYLLWKNMPFLQLILNLPFLIPGFLVKTLFFCKKRMGILYVKGLLQGLKLSFSQKGRAKKVQFCRKHLGNYFAIQMQLYANLFRIIMKT